MLINFLAVEEPRWPPKSPYEALLSSPNGRRKAQQLQRSTSPSPLKRSTTASGMRRIQRQLDHGSPSNEDEDEDEETLKLQLATLEARLKLKKLQSKKTRATGLAMGHEDNPGSHSLKRATSVLSRRRDDRPNDDRTLTRSKSSTAIQVPLSPERKQNAGEEALSPGRVLLGIDKGLKGKNISLRKAPGTRNRMVTSSALDDPFGGKIKSSSGRSTATDVRSSSVSHEAEMKKSMSFSERIAETRKQDKEQRALSERTERLRAQRSTGFGVQQQDLDAFRSTSSQADVLRPNSRYAARENVAGFSREEVMKAFNKPSGGLLHRSRTVSGVRNTRPNEALSAVKSSDPQSRPRSSASSQVNASSVIQPQPPSSSSDQNHRSRSTTPSTDHSLYEPFSSTELSKRILPHTFLARTLADKKVVLIPSLLRDIKSPLYVLPPSLEESDFVLFGIIASKSSPLNHKDTHRTNDNSNSSSLTEAAESEANARGKYMVMTLTDLKWTIDLYLFTTAYTRFWKLVPGTVVAILNPSIMPPPPGKTDTGRFSLTLSSSDDTILEVGTARDLAFCRAVRKNGRVCNSWVDGKHTEFCEWHVDQGVEKCRRGRMEVQGMSAPFAPGGRRSGRTGMFGSNRGSKKKDDDGNGNGNGLKREGAQYDRSTQSRYFIAPSLGSIHSRSAAKLIDMDDQGILADKMTREERTRKTLASHERELSIAKCLGEAGNGTGAEYLRLRQHAGSGVQNNGDHSHTEEKPNDVDAKALGLKGNLAKHVHLSPLKKGGGGGKRKVIDVDGGGGEGRERKKTRFVTDKGIREAGRESSGGFPCGSGGEAGNREVKVENDDEDDDDDLDIV